MPTVRQPISQTQQCPPPNRERPAHRGEKLRLGIGGVRAKVVHPGQFQAGHHSDHSVPQRHCSIQNASRPCHTSARSRQYEEQLADVAREEGEAVAQTWTPAQGDPGSRQQPELVCGMPPQAPKHNCIVRSALVKAFSWGIQASYHRAYSSCRRGAASCSLVCFGKLEMRCMFLSLARSCKLKATGHKMQADVEEGFPCLGREVGIQHVSPGRMQTDPSRLPREVEMTSTGCRRVSGQRCVYYDTWVQGSNLNQHICFTSKPIANNAHIRRRQFNTRYSRHVVVHDGCTSCANPSADCQWPRRPVARGGGPPSKACLQVRAGIAPAVTQLLAVEAAVLGAAQCRLDVSQTKRGRARPLLACMGRSRAVAIRARPLGRGRGSTHTIRATSVLTLALRCPSSTRSSRARRRSSGVACIRSQSLQVGLSQRCVLHQFVQVSPFASAGVGPTGAAQGWAQCRQEDKDLLRDIHSRMDLRHEPAQFASEVGDRKPILSQRVQGRACRDVQFWLHYGE